MHWVPDLKLEQSLEVAHLDRASAHTNSCASHPNQRCFWLFDDPMPYQVFGKKQFAAKALMTLEPYSSTSSYQLQVTSALHLETLSPDFCVNSHSQLLPFYLALCSNHCHLKNDTSFLFFAT